MAPELMGDCLDEPEQSIPRVTMATDSWAFAMTVVEVRISVYIERTDNE
jgi:hypothetical protein